MVYSDLEAWV